MGKKLLSTLISFLFVMMLIPAASYADGAKDGAYAQAVQGNNGKITIRIQKRSDSADEEKKLELLVEQANKKIEQAVKKAQATPWDDVDELIEKVTAIATEVFDYAESIGAEVACDYVEYYIDGQTVLIDPLRVVRL